MEAFQFDGFAEFCTARFGAGWVMVHQRGNAWRKRAGIRIVSRREMEKAKADFLASRAQLSLF